MPPDEERLRSVLFLTDGFIGNEADILTAIDSHLGHHTRLHALGVGSSVNRYLLDRMSRRGRGALEVVLIDEAADAAVARFYARVRRPVVTDVEIAFAGGEVHGLSPGRLPDLLAGQPVTLLGRYHAAGPATVTITGRTRRGPFHEVLEVQFPSVGDDHPGLRSLWARGAVEELEANNLAGDDPTANAQVEELGLRYGLVTRRTSLVAVDSAVSPREGRPALRVPLAMPYGVDLESAAGAIEDAGLAHPREEAPVCPNEGRGGSAGGLSGFGSGFGAGGWGYGMGSFGSKGRETPAPSSAPVTRSSIDASLIRRIVYQAIPDLRRCYSDALRLSPDLAGRVVMRFTIRPTGVVGDAGVRSSTLGDDEVEECLRKRFERLQFPEPRGEGEVQVTYPLVFRPVEADGDEPLGS